MRNEDIKDRLLFGAVLGLIALAASIGLSINAGASILLTIISALLVLMSAGLGLLIAYLRLSNRISTTWLVALIPLTGLSIGILVVIASYFWYFFMRTR